MNRTIKGKVKYNHIKINSIIIGVFLSLSMITKLLTSFVVINNNIPMMASALFIFSLINNKFRFKKNILLIWAIILSVFMFSLIRLNFSIYTVNYLFGFIIHGIFGMYLISHEFETKSLINTINIIFFIFSIYLLPSYVNQIQARTLSVDFTMDLSYTVLVGLIATIIKINTYQSKRKLVNILNVLIIIYSLYYLFFVNLNRGSMAAFFIFLVIFFIKNIKNVLLRRILVFISTILVIILSINYNPMLTKLTQLQLDIPALQRMISQYNHGFVTSGRDRIWRNALGIIMENPFFGGGIGVLETNYGYYAHNLLLQTMGELGLILSIPIIFLSLYPLIKIMTSEYREYHIILILLFCISIPRLLISETIWNSSAFWMLIYLSSINLLRNINYTKRFHSNSKV